MSQLSSAFEQLSINTIESGTVKAIVDLITNLTKLIDTVGIGTIAFGAFFAIINKKSGITAMVSATTIMNKAMADSNSVIGGLLTGLKTLTTSLMASAKAKITGATASTTLATGELVATTATGALTTALGALMATIAPLAIAMAGFKLITEGISFIGGLFDTESVEEMEEKVSDLTDKLQNLKSEYQTLMDTDNRTEEQDTRLKQLEKEIQLNELLLEQENRKIADEKYTGEYKSASGSAGAPSYLFGSDLDIAKDMQENGSYDSALQLMTERYQKLGEEAEELNKKIEALGDITNDNKDEYADLSEQLQETTGYQAELGVEMGTTIQEMERLGEANFNEYSWGVKETAEEVMGLNEELEVTPERANTAQEAVQGLGDAGENIGSAFDTLTESMNLMNTAIKEMDSNGQLSIETVMSMVEAGYNLTDMLTYENGVYKLNADAVANVFEVKKASAIMEIQQKKEVLDAIIGFMEAEIVAYEQGTNANTTRVEREAQAINGMNQQVVLNAQSLVASLGEVGDGASKYLAKQAESIISQLPDITSNNFDAYKQTLQGLKQQSNQYQQSIDVLSNMTLPQFTNSVNKNTGATKKNTGASKENTKALEQNKKAQEALQRQIDATKDALERENEAFEKQKKWNEVFIDNVVKILEKEIDLLEKEKEAVEARYDAEIEAIKYRIELLDDTAKQEDKLKDLAEAQLDIERKRQALEEIRQNRNVKTYVEGKAFAPNLLYRLKDRDV